MVKGQTYRNILEIEYTRRLSTNPRYSKRAFSKSLGISSSALSEIISGKRGLSLKKAEGLLGKLKLPTHEQMEFIESVKSTKAYFRNRESGYLNDNKYFNLSDDKFSYIADWYHFAILNIASLENQVDDHQAIAQRLGITENIANEAIDRLKRLGLIDINKEKIIYRTTNSIKTTDDVPSTALKIHHSQMIEKAKESLFNTPIELRDISGITIPIDISNIDKARKKIKKFRRELADFLCQGEPTQVYNLNIQLFPLERGQNEK